MKRKVFPYQVAGEELDKIDDDILNAHIQKALNRNMFTFKAEVNPHRLDDYIAIKKAAKVKLERKAKPSYFLIHFVYPIVVSLIVYLVVRLFTLGDLIYYIQVSKKFFSNLAPR